MKKLTVLAAFLLVLSACNKEMPTPPDSNSGYGDIYADPSDPNQDPYSQNPYDYTGDPGDSGNYSGNDGNYSGDDGGDSGDDGSDDGSGDDGGDDSGGRYTPHQHHSANQPLSSSATPRQPVSRTPH